MGRSPILIAVLAGGTMASIASAQPTAPGEGPVVVGARSQTWKTFELEKLTAAFEFLGQYRNEELRQQGQKTVHERESLLRETLDLSAQGAIGHKNLIDLTGTAKFGLDNRTLDSDLGGGTSREWNFVDLFDIRALILGNGPVPTTLYARRDESLIDQGFGGRFTQTITEAGIVSQFRSGVAPTTIQYFHREQDLTYAFNQVDSTTTQDTFTGQSAIHISRTQRLDIAYTFDRMDERQGTFSDKFDRHDANIVHTLNFGPEERRHELRSSLRIYDQGGEFAQNDTRLDELLVLRHTDRLETRYSAMVDEQTAAGQDQRFYRGEASIRHRLFDSLVSLVSVGGSRLDAPENFTSDDVFVTGQFDYTKKVPLGRLDASFGIRYDELDNSERGSTLAVSNDALVATGPLPVTIPRRNIVTGSLVLRPPSGFPPYQEGVDYTVQYFPDRVEITILPGSAIQTGQVFFANYDIGPEPASQIDTLGTVVSARYSLTEGTLRGLSIYSIYRTVDHGLTTVDPSLFVLDDFQDLLMGVEYTRAGLDLKYEHEERWSNVDPFRSDRFQAMYIRSLGRDSSLSIDFSHQSIEHQFEDNRVDYDRITGRWDQRVTPNFDFNVRLEYRNDRDQIAGDTEGFDQVVGFTWHKGQTNVFFSVQNAFLQTSSSDRTSQLFQFGLKRDF